MMVKEITDNEVMTLQRAREKYATKWFDYVLVDGMNDNDPDASLCYVVVIADTEEEIYSHPDPERNLRSGGVSSGDKVVFPMEVGGIYVHA